MSPGIHGAVVQNWRALGAIDFEPDDEVSWVMGPNGSGKSSILDALVFPCDLLRSPHEPRVVLSELARGAPIARGSWRFEDLLHDPTEPASWSFDFTDVEEQRWRYLLVLSAQGAGFAVEQESLERLADGGWASVLEQDVNGARLVRGGWPHGSWVPMVGQPTVPLLARATDPIEHAAVAGALAFLKGVWLLHPDPLLMRGRTVAYDPERPPDRYGRDLEGLLESLVSGYPAEFSGVLDALSEISGWRAIRALQRGQERRVVFEESPGRPLVLDLASDGQLVAAWLTALATFPPEAWTVALIDEPATALARGPQRQLFSWLRDLAANVQVIAATHDELAPNLDTRDSVWLVTREPGEPATLERLDRHKPANDFPDIFKPGEVAARVSTAGEE